MELLTRIDASALDGREVRRARDPFALAEVLSPRRLVVFVLLASIFTMSAEAITDPDFWWHLRTGQLIFETRAIPRVDVFSFTAHGGEWVTHEWLTEVVMYATYRLGGWGALAALFSFVTTTALWLIYRRALSRGADQLVACAATLIAAFATMPIWGVRPQMISFLLTSVFIYALDDYSRSTRTRSRISRAPWLLIPLMLVWVNMHGGFALGLALIVLTCAGIALDELLRRDDELLRRDDASLRQADELSQQGDELSLHDGALLQREDESSQRGGELTHDGAMLRGRVRRVWSRVRPLCFVFAACVAVVPLNPSGWRLFSYPFETINSPAMQKYILEWHSPDFHQPYAHALALLLFATFAALALSPERTRAGDVLLVCVAAYAALRSWRNIPFFALVAAPLLAEQAWSLIRTWDLTRQSNRTKKQRGETKRRDDETGQGRDNPVMVRLALNAALLVCVPVALCALRVSSVARSQSRVEAEKFPSAAVEFLRGRTDAGALFNDYGWGGYLIWKLYPERLVFVDGRADVYGDALVEEYLSAEGGEQGWRATLDRHNVRTVMIKPDAALASLLREDAGWSKVFEDEQAAIFFKR